MRSRFKRELADKRPHLAAHTVVVPRKTGAKLAIRQSERRGIRA